MTRSIYLWAAVAAIVFSCLVWWISDIDRLSGIGTLYLPGMMIASLIVAGGIHSDHGIAYLWLATIINTVLYFFALSWVGLTMAKRRERRRRAQ